MKRCFDCGQGTLHTVVKYGVPAIPTCDYCGAEWIDPETAKALDAAAQVAPDAASESASGDTGHERGEP